MSQNWKDKLSTGVEQALSQGVIPIELAQEKVMLALTLALVKGVCELVPSLTRSLFDTMLQYISHRRPRWLLSCTMRGNHPIPLEVRRSKHQTAILILRTTLLSRDCFHSRSENVWKKNESCALTHVISVDLVKKKKKDFCNLSHSFLSSLFFLFCTYTWKAWAMNINAHACLK